MSLHQLTIRARLSIGFGILLALLVAVAGTSLVQLAGFNRNVEALANVRLVQLITGAQAGNVLGSITRSTGNALVLDDEKQVQAELASVRKNEAAVKDLLAKLETRVAPGQERQLFDAILQARATYAPHEEEFLKLAESGDYSSAKDVLLKTTRPAQMKLLEALDAFEHYQVQASGDEATKAAEAYALTRAVVVGLAVAAVLLGLLLAWSITISITRPIGAAVEVAQRVAGGDLTVQVQAGGRDETGLLLRALAEMTGNLRQLVGEVAGGAHTVAETSAQIAQGNGDLSQRTEEQAGTLEETASSMEELTATVTQNADNARQATQLAGGATGVARKGGEVVGQVVATMTEISESSRRIADIIGVIDGIAFQTNILALNAAVEAARAGEQGRGFAVVAAEVRNLAQRSAAAAKEIKGLIGDSVGKVEAGTRLVGAAGNTMTEIVASVQKVSDLISEIAAASQEQSSGIKQVNTAISQMEQVVQQNASLVEESAAATESMKAQADALLQTVARFKLGGAAMPVDQAASAVPIPMPVPVPVPVPVPAAALPPAAPAPIRFKPGPRLPAAPAGTLTAMNGRGAAGEWREF